MHYLLVIYIPIVLTILWAVRRTDGKGDRVNALLLLACGAIVVTNGVIRHFVFDGFELPNWLCAVQQVLASLIVPLAYTFFARLAGRAWNNETTLSLFALLGFLLFPNLVVMTDGTFPTDAMKPEPLAFHSFCIIGTGGSRYEYTIADFIIVLQAIVTLIRLLPIYHTIKRYGLSLSTDVKLFLAWWVSAVAFIVFSSFNSTIGMAEPVMNTTCHVLFMFVVIWIFYLLGKGFDLRPVFVTEEEDVKEKEPVELDTFVQQSKEMAERVKALVYEQRVYLQSGYNADKAVSELGTNRTYFYRMIKTQFKCTFSELLNRERVKEVKHLLETTDESLVVIAEKCGFSDASYMIKVFKHEVGQTPKEWRDKNVINNKSTV